MRVKRTEWQRLLGLTEWVHGASKAADCREFLPDVEEEHVADETISCYNCRYRRWLMDGISCCADAV